MLNICHFCQNQFKSYRSSILYCSSLCKYNGYMIKFKENQKKPKAIKEIKQKIIKKCEECFLDHSRVNTNICKKCHSRIQDKKRYEERKKNPELHEFYLNENKIRSQRLLRKKKLLPLDHPPLRRKNGEGNINNEGYKIISKRDHPNSLKNGTILEHKFIMSQFLGRPLSLGENVHHKNGVRHDNRIENLELWSVRQPPGQRVDDKIEWCKEFLSEYGYDVIKKI